MYDVTNQTTFDNLDHWHQEFLMHAQVREEFPFLLLGNKVSYYQIISHLEKLRIIHFSGMSKVI